jgi:acyl-CoA reductase-like NAD-dependent aldehyde dehydrogenase
MPRGVVLVISPWNYPMQLAMVPMLSALASGNTVILKPSEVTPLVGKCIEDLFIKAGFPEGVVQVAHGGKEVGAAFTTSKPDYIFFTGSVRTGKTIQQVAANDLIPTTLELGGKDPMIVFADAHLERAAKGAAWAAFTNSGQVCMSAERLYVK